MMGLVKLCIVLFGVGVAYGDHGNSETPSNMYDFYRLPRADMFNVDASSQSILVGGRGQLVELSMDLATVKQTAVFSLTADMKDECRSLLSINGRLDEEPYYCFRDVTVVLLPRQLPPTSDLQDSVLVCSAHYTDSSCAHRKRDSLEETVTVPGQGSGTYYAAHDLDVQTQALVGDDSHFWGLSADGFQDKLLFKRTTFGLTFSDTVWIRSDSERRQWFDDPGYGSILEVEDYVYVFFWERAQEEDSDRWITVARVARVCKSDPGIWDARINAKAFSSFVKAELSCNSASSAQSASKVYPFVVDAYYVESGHFQPNTPPQKYIYALFQASNPLVNDGPTGSAVCVFDYNKIDAALSSSQLVNLKTGATVNNAGPVNCDTYSGRTIQEVTEVTLSPNVVTNEETVLGKPVYLLADGERFSQLAVDSAAALDGTMHDVVFVLSTHKFFKTLYLYKVSYILGRRTNSKVNYKLKLVENSEWEFVDSERFGRYSPEEGKRIKIIKSDNQTWVYLTSEAGVFRVRSDVCDQYTSCEQCLGAVDPHCAFDTVQHKCVSVADSTNRSVLIQELTSNNPSDSCTGVVQPTVVLLLATQAVTSSSPVTVDSSTSNPASPTATPRIVGPVENITTGAVTEETTGKTVEWWPFIVGGVVGIFVGIVAGIFVSLFWRHRVAIRRANKSLSALPQYVASYSPEKNGSARGKEMRNARTPSVEVLVEKQNNAVDPAEYHRKESPPLHEDYHNFSLSRSKETLTEKADLPSASSSPAHDEADDDFVDPQANLSALRIRRTKSDHDAVINSVRKPSEQTSSESAVSLHDRDLNLADSSSDTPGSPITNGEWKKFQDNLQPGSVVLDSDYKLRNVPVANGNRRHSYLSQGNGDDVIDYKARNVTPSNRRHSHLSQGSCEIEIDHRVRNTSLPPVNPRHSYLSQSSFVMNGGAYINDQVCQSPTLSTHSTINEGFTSEANRASLRSSSYGPHEASSPAVTSPGSKHSSRSRRNSLFTSFGKSKGVDMNPSPPKDSFDC